MSEDARLAGLLAGQRVLLCFGLFGEVMAGLKPLGVDYLVTQGEWLRGLGVPVETPVLPSAAAVEANAAEIARLIEADARPAVLVGHSKGGLEALAAMLRPGIAGKVRGFVALQSPFGGSPVADWVCSNAPIYLASHHALKALGLGSGRGVQDLTTRLRRAWMRRHHAQVLALAERVPMASLGTALGPQDGGPYVLLARRIEQMGFGPNDGLVPVASTELPGARHQVLAGDHRALVAQGRGQDPVRVLRDALLGVLG